MNATTTALIVVIFFVIIGGAGYYFYTKQQTIVTSDVIQPTDILMEPQWSSLAGFDYPGNDLPGSPYSNMSADTCMNKCKNTSGCIAAMWSPANLLCWLKKSISVNAVSNKDRTLLVRPAYGGVSTWTAQRNQDHGGDDIACYKDGNKGSDCAALCAWHNGCKAYNTVSRAIGKDWSMGGCCVKRVAAPTSPVINIDFYSGAK